MRRALVLLCLLVFTVLPQAYASTAIASPALLQPVAAAGDTVTPIDFQQTGDHYGAEEHDHDPITPSHALRQALPFYAIIWQAGPGALSEADVRPAMRPPRVRH